MTTHVTRFAPSPTGRLHLGNARTALFSWLLARGSGGRFVLRVEDTDRERCDEAHVQAQLEDLRWLGIDWDEGPDVGGPHGPYRQTERGEQYRVDYNRLLASGLAYPCFCSDDELAAERRAQRLAGRPPRYSGRCARLALDEVERRLAAGEAAALRFRVPTGVEITFDDAVRGAQRFLSDDIGDFVIRRRDGGPAFFFGNAVDDADMAISLVVRGEDHLANTPRQLLLQQALERPEPGYAHISLIVGEDGSPLSKRHGSFSLHDLREAGFLPLAVANYLARLGHACERHDLLDLPTLAQHFQLDRLSRSPARHDEAQLLHWQRLAVAAADWPALWAWMGPAVHRLVPDSDAEAFVAAVRENLLLPQDGLAWAQTVYSDPLPIDSATRDALTVEAGDFFLHALRALAVHGTDFAALAKQTGQEAEVRGKALYRPLRLALTGREHGPDMGALLPLITVERARRRLEAWASAR